MDQEQLGRELAELRARVEELEGALAAKSSRPWRATTYYGAYYALTGSILGMLGALASLLVNVIGSLIVGQHPLELIRVYLTFPLGERALQYTMVDHGLALVVGMCLYVVTGMALGVPFHLALTYWTPGSSLLPRLALVSTMALVLWVVNFYGILSWLQPLLFGGNWIVRLVPWYVGALTHLVFGWTMVLVYPLGLYTPYLRETEKPWPTP
jgi:hypothetical protein